MCHVLVTTFLGAFAELPKATMCFVMSVCLSVRLSVHMNSSALSGQIYMKFDVPAFSKTLIWKFKFH